MKIKSFFDTLVLTLNTETDKQSNRLFSELDCSNKLVGTFIVHSAIHRSKEVSKRFLPSSIGIIELNVSAKT